MAMPTLELLDQVHALAYQCERIATRCAELQQRCCELEQLHKAAPTRRATDTRSAAWWSTFNAALPKFLELGHGFGDATGQAARVASYAHGEVTEEVRHG
jgi:hypothetical protein